MEKIRYTPMTQKDLTEKIIADYSKGKSWEYYSNKSLDDMLLRSTIMLSLPYEDLDIGFDFENVTCTKGRAYDDGDGLVGLGSIKDFSFLGCIAGGDWEIPVFFIIYYDEKKKLRAYIPKEGNIYNKETMIAYGNDLEGDETDEHSNDKYNWDLIKKEIETKIGKNTKKENPSVKNCKKPEAADEEPLTIYMMIGLPASGKSFITNSIYKDLPVVSKDLYKGSEAKEKKKLEELLSEGKSVVVDDTNYNKKTRAKIISTAKKYDADVIGIYVRVEKQTALERNKKRGKKVPAIAIHTIASKFEEPELSEGFTKLNIMDND